MANIDLSLRDGVTYSPLHPISKSQCLLHLISPIHQATSLFQVGQHGSLVCEVQTFRRSAIQKNLEGT
ncbi:hypothetical protein [Ornatilinea apprima]|uniref:hypothetical protein n=1 Tax=Ornatilinea apprima TaxID=1134406 RepID=UPI00128EC6FC|nr:hypothetical protein [Ornatilinea apprima]